MKKKILFSIVACLLSFSVFSQCLKIDSLRRVLNVAIAKGQDTLRIDLLNQVAAEHLVNKQDGMAWQIAQQAMALAKQLNYPEGQADALIVIGGVFDDDPLKREKETPPKYLEALEIYKKVNNSTKIAFACKTIGDFYYNLFYVKEGHFAEALTYYEQYVENIEKTNNKLEIAKAYAFIGNMYEEFGEDSKSKEYFQKAVELRKQIPDAEVDDPLLFAKVEKSYSSQLQADRIYIYILVVGMVLAILLILTLFIYLWQKARSNRILTLQNEQIERQRASITEKNLTLEKQKEEIQQQHDQLTEQHKLIVNAQAEIKMANEKLLTVNQKLEEMVNERTTDLQKTNLALTEANEELDTLIYRASHDFKGPVATLTGLAQVARMECEEDSPATEFLNKIEYTAQKMDMMLEKLHQVSYLIGKHLMYEVIDFEEIIEEAKNLLSPNLQNVDIEYNLEIDEGVRLISDSELLTILLENMIENAIQYRTQDPNKKPVIHIRIKPEGDLVRIEVEDNGIGIPYLYFTKIYDMFFRGTELAKGNGLGLYVVKKALEKMQGEIELFSEENEYSLFRIRLPK
jgi:signal transduction histidine kinase